MPGGKLNLSFQPVSRELMNNAGGDVLNLFARKPESEYAKYAATMLSTPGTDLYIKLPGEGGVHGVMRFGDRLAVQTSDGLYMVAADGQSHETLLAAFGEKSDMATDGRSIAFIRDGVAYLWDVDNGVRATAIQGEEAGDGAYITVEYLNGFYVWTAPEVMHAMTAGNLQWRDGDFAVAARYSDNMVAARRFHSQLWVFGETTIEAWQGNTGDGFPFIPANDIVFPVGCTAPDTIRHFQNAIFWLGADAQVRMATSTSDIQVVGNAAVSEAVRNSDLSRARAYTYTEDGGSHYVLCLTESTWAYEMVAGVWHRRAFADTGRHHASCSVMEGGRILAGHATRPLLMRMGRGIGQDIDNTAIIREVVTPVVEDNQNWFKVLQVGLDILRGKSNTELKVGVSCSEDGAITWNRETVHEFGERGEYGQRVTFHRMGRSRGRHFRFRIYGGGAAALHGGYVQVSQ